MMIFALHIKLYVYPSLFWGFIFVIKTQNRTTKPDGMAYITGSEVLPSDGVMSYEFFQIWDDFCFLGMYFSGI
jgi:hypothetical protein